MSDIRLPSRREQWKEYASHHGVLHTNIHSLDILDSASKIKDPQFYALRILWLEQPKLLSAQELCNGRVIKEAKSFLEKPAWEDYLKDVKEKTGSSSLSTLKDIGTFSLVRYNQIRAYSSPLAGPDYQLTNDVVESVFRKVVQSPSPVAHRTRSRHPNLASSGSPLTPTPKPRFQTEYEQLSMTQLNNPLSDIEESFLHMLPKGSNDPPSPESPANAAENIRSEDEQIVNMALILFLETLTIHHPKLQSEGFNSPRWTIKRLQLKCGSWEARTDGF